MPNASSRRGLEEASASPAGVVRDDEAHVAQGIGLGCTKVDFSSTGFCELAHV